MCGQRPREFLGGGVLDAHHRGTPRLGAIAQDPFRRQALCLALATRPRRLCAGLPQRLAEVAPALVAGVGAAHQHAGEFVSERMVGVIGAVRPEAERSQCFRESATLPHVAGQLGAGSPARRAWVRGGS